MLADKSISDSNKSITYAITYNDNIIEETLPKFFKLTLFSYLLNSFYHIHKDKNIQTGINNTAIKDLKSFIVLLFIASIKIGNIELIVAL